MKKRKFGIEKVDFTLFQNTSLKYLCFKTPIPNFDFIKHGFNSQTYNMTHIPIII